MSSCLINMLKHMFNIDKSLTYRHVRQKSVVGACAGRQQRLPVELLVLNACHHDVYAAFPRQLHVRRIQRVSHEEADILRQRYRPISSSSAARILVWGGRGALELKNFKVSFYS